MGHHNGGAALHEPLHGVLNQHFRFGINVGSGLVHDQNGGVKGQRPGKAQKLPLTGGKGGATLGYRSFIALLQLGNKAISIDKFGCTADLTIG